MPSPLITGGTNTKVTVGNTTTTILAANNARLGAKFVNTSDEAITLSFGEDAVLTEGVVLSASGGAYTMDGNDLDPRVINGICASGGKVLSVVEQT